MPRLLRITIPDIPFHILNRGNNRQVIFKENSELIPFFIDTIFHHFLNRQIKFSKMEAKI